MIKLSALKRLTRVLDFIDTDVVVTGEIIQNSSLISRFNSRKINNDWPVDEVIKV